MAFSNYSINYSAILAGTAADVSVGMAVLNTTSGFVPATSANRTAYGSRSYGIALTAGEAGEAIQIAYDGVISAAVSGLADGTAGDYVVVAADATLTRTSSPGGSDDIIGICPGITGDVAVKPVSSTGGGGGGSFTPPTGTGFATVTGGVLDVASLAFPLTVAKGGTGQSSLTSGNILTGNGAGAVSSFTPAAGVQTFLTTPSSANLRAAVTDKTGTGALYFAGGNFGAATGTSAALTSFLSVAGAAQAATTGTIRLPDDGTIYGRVTADNADAQLFSWTGGAIIIGGANDTYLYGGNGKQLTTGFDTYNFKNGLVSSQFATMTSTKFELGQGVLLKLADSSGGQFYTFDVPNLVANRTITLPLLTGNDTMVCEAHTQTLTNKTIAGASNTLSVRIANDVTGLGTGVATFLATPSSANLAAALTDETGSGAAVFATNPSLTGPTITTSVTLGTSGMLTTANANTKGTSYDKTPVNVQTTDATVTTLDSFTLASNTAVTVTWIVSAVKSDISAAAGYSVSAVFKNNAGTVAQVGTTLTTPIGESNSAWDCTIDNSTTTIRLRVTGVAATTIQWSAIMTRLDVIP